MRKKIFLSIFAFLLCFAYVYGQRGTVTYDFRDETIISAKQTTDGALKLGGTFSLKDATYGLDMKVGGTIKIAVPGSRTIRFLGSAYSGLNLEGKTKAGVALEPTAKVTKVATNLVDVFDFVYYGLADTLIFTTVAATGNDLYLPKIDVIPAQAGKDTTAAGKNLLYDFNLRDKSIVAAGGTTTIQAGLFKLEAGTSNAYGYNDAIHGIVCKTGNKITLTVAGNSYIKLGGCQYSDATATVTASSTTGSFNATTKATKTTNCYHVDSTTVDILYVGTAGTVVLEFTNQTYIPVIKVVPVPYAVELTPWSVKKGTISINGTDINLTAGANPSAYSTVTMNRGIVISATDVLASVRVNLGGKALSSFTPTFNDSIASVTVSSDTLLVTYLTASKKPYSYKIVVADSSAVGVAEAGKTYSYPLNDGTVLPQLSISYATFFTKDNLVNLNSNTTIVSKQFAYHDAAHGAVLYPGNSIDFTVAGNATITFGTCMYGSATDAIFEFKNAAGTVLGSCSAKSTGACGTNSFSYTGDKGVITATLKSTLFPSAQVYIHGVTVENAAKIETSNGKIDVWDFGAEQLDPNFYNNRLDSATINSWYATTITPGSTGFVLPSSFIAGVLSWVGGTNDRLRTTNTKLTRYDQNIASVTGYTGRLYVNGAAATGRYLSLTLSADDEVSIITRADATGNLNFQYVASPTSQTNTAAISTVLDTLNFVAKEAGTYHIFDNLGKPSYFRIYRKDATYVTINGTVDVTAAAGIPAGYGITLKNSAGKTWNATVLSGTFLIKVPAGYTYSLSLSNANGYVISNGFSLDVTTSTTTYNVAIKKVELYKVSGKINGMDTTNIKKLKLGYTSDPLANKIYIPEAVINYKDSTYSVQLEPSCKYTITASGVNDYKLTTDTMKIRQVDSISNLAFVAKPVYSVTINASGLTAEQLAKLSLIFTNLNESGYTYTFSSLAGISLRDGTYSISYSGLDDYPVQMALVSNLKVAGTAVSKNMVFNPVTVWSFDDKTIANGTSSHKGLLFSGNVYNELAKGHLVAKSGATIKVPVNAGNRVGITYYYSAAISINNGDTIRTATASTSVFEYAEYKYTGTAAGYVTIAIGSGTTYLPEITVSEIIPYKSPIYVGTDKEYKTVNEALSAIAKMDRTSTDRVVVMIDPGNYEEMLVVTTPNVTLKNASKTPSIALKNSGVDIDANAVRITSYYGHGYNYFSMGTNQKWNADVLSVNRANGYTSYSNTGSGTTNGSYWNATVVISANGFIAKDIIFENSFNQYISKKESQDSVLWVSGATGARPKTVGSTGVQARIFVERAAAIAITNNTDKVVLSKCRVVGRQDAFYGGTGTRVAVIKGAVMGAVDYIFGGMTAVFYKTDLVMNVSDVSSDAAYITAAQQSSGRGFLMYECNVKSAIPGIETASTYLAKPGYFGRPWQPTTSEVVFYKTNVDTSNYTGYRNQSLIMPAGWNSGLGGESPKMYEYGTIEKSGVNNSANRVTWAKVLTTPTLSDGTEITTFNFTKGTDNWDPIPGTLTVKAANKSKVYGDANPELTLSYEGFVNDDDTSVLTSIATATTSATTTSVAGSYAITASGASSEDYTLAYTNGTLTVEKAKLMVTADNKTKVYGSANPELTFGFAGFVNGETSSVLTSPVIASTTATALSGAGSYAIAASGGAADNYSLTYVDGTLTVNKANLTATADNKSKVYGSANPDFTISYDGFVNGESSSSITEPVATSSATEASKVGTYDITLTGGSSLNYNISLTKGTLDVTKAPLTATADNQTRKVGEANPAFTITYSGFVNGDDATAVSGISATCSADQQSVAGTYDIVLSGGSADNYTLTLANGVLTVTPATGVHSTNATGIEIYPNPVSSEMVVKRGNSGAETLQIVNGQGLKLIEKTLSSDVERIDVSGLAKGTYIVLIGGNSYKLLVK
jgi:pectin methylesterase-like acyl-CoA thioesterase